MMRSMEEVRGAVYPRSYTGQPPRLAELEGQHFWDAFCRAADWSAQLTMQMWGE